MQDFKIAIANCLKEKIEDLTLEEIVALIDQHVFYLEMVLGLWFYHLVKMKEF